MKNPLTFAISFCLVVITLVAAAWLVNDMAIKRRAARQMEQAMQQQKAAQDATMRALQQQGEAFRQSSEGIAP